VEKNQIVDSSLNILWSDGRVENLMNMLPENIQEELQIYFNELEDSRERGEHDYWRPS
jgi:hypothetical protein